MEGWKQLADCGGAVRCGAVRAGRKSEGLMGEGKGRGKDGEGRKEGWIRQTGSSGW
jgi:hypothetical protein